MSQAICATPPARKKKLFEQLAKVYITKKLTFEPKICPSRITVITPRCGRGNRSSTLREDKNFFTVNRFFLDVSLDELSNEPKISPIGALLDRRESSKVDDLDPVAYIKFIVSTCVCRTKCTSVDTYGFSPLRKPKTTRLHAASMHVGPFHARNTRCKRAKLEKTGVDPTNQCGAICIGSYVGLW